MKKLFTILLLTITFNCASAQSKPDIVFKYTDLKGTKQIILDTSNVKYLMRISGIPNDSVDALVANSTFEQTNGPVQQLGDYLKGLWGQKYADSIKSIKSTSNLNLNLDSKVNKGNLTTGKKITLVFGTGKKPADNLAHIEFSRGVAGSKATTDTGKVKAESDRSKVLAALLPLDTAFIGPAFKFIDREMFDGLATFGYSSLVRCMSDQDDKRLPGEYIWLYDMQRGDYYTLKKIIKKSTDTRKINGLNCDGKYVEYYKWVKSMFYSPPVGAQFKVELMNYTSNDALSLTLAYKDNFLEDEGKFSTMLNSAANFKKDTSKADTAKKNDSKVNSSGDDKLASTTAVNLIDCKNDLYYYTKNFYFNSATIEKHARNIQAINKHIHERFGMSMAEVIKLYKSDKDDKLTLLVKYIELLYNKVYSYKTTSFLAEKLKNHDYLTMTLKDAQGNVKKTEEIRLSGGFKIDFSSGVLITGLKNQTFAFMDTTVKYRRSTDTTTSLKTLKDTTGRIAIRQNNSKQKIGFGVLMHAYPRISSNYNIAVTTGLSVNTETELNVLLGGSVLLGSTRRLVLSGGVIWGKTDRLNSTVKLGLNRSDPNNIYSAPKFYTDSTVPVISDWDHSWFFGITYNFTAR
ncbi:hypothetical protein ACEN9X_25925 [Mucilaginibacter sp. Mucisp86]|uniref:hypothetical protein n=1 Tax=Mucilaginibacter sp. Mucisp86 TaxID=3243060 RepID=UPI0039B48DCD